MKANNAWFVFPDFERSHQVEIYNLGIKVRKEKKKDGQEKENCPICEWERVRIIKMYAKPLSKILNHIFLK